MKTTNYNFHIAELIGKLIKGELTPKESLSLNNWLKEDKRNIEFFDKLIDPEFLESQQKKYNSADSVMLWEKLAVKLDNDIKVNSWQFRLLKYAAIALPFIFGAGLLILRSNNPHQVSTKSSMVSAGKIDIMPGGKNAILILSNGEKVTLGGSAKQVIKEKDGTCVNNRNDVLSYNQHQPSSMDGVLFNNLVIPRGGYYEMVLADGTKVWINSMSELRYPTRFTGAERKVYLKGEAYFEVSKNAKMPFIVKTDQEEVKVLGTHFNIMAYGDEQDVKTTLIEGAISISSGSIKGLLKPGQQAIIKNNQLKINYDVDIDEVIAWKNGLFEFKNTNVEQVMRNAARWYDIDVRYEGSAPDTELTGRISRNVNLSGLINILRFEGVNFRIEGKKITVLNN